MEPKVIINYVRDKNGNPIGCVVATAAGQLGACFLNKADRKGISKRRMIDLARVRALESSHIERNSSNVKKLVSTSGKTWNIPQCMLKSVEYMIDRSYRYFK
jgi:hypothetical protein